MRHRIVSLRAVSLVLMTIGACHAGDQALPLRQECIVKIALDWPSGISIFEQDAITDRIGHVISQAAATLGQDYLVDLAIPGDSKNAVYLQFKRNCTARVQMASRISSYVKKIVEDSPRMIVLTETIEPGPKTIDVWGPSWTDGPSR